MKSVILLFALILNLTGCLGLTGFFTPKAWVSQDVYISKKGSSSNILIIYRKQSYFLPSKRQLTIILSLFLTL
jgi:hypothetical protein